MKAKREEERQRIERDNQKRITEWVRQSSKRRDDLKEEKSQLAAMKLKREAASFPCLPNQHGSFL